MIENNDVQQDTNPSQKSHSMICYLTSTISGFTGQSLWSSVIDAAQENNLNLLSIVGQCLNHPVDNQAQANILYEFARAGAVEGITSWASSIGTYVSPAENRAFHERLHRVPIVPMGATVDGFSGLVIDGYPGMREAIVHLITVHGHRRIAFIRGPEAHAQAQERYRAYTETLESLGVTIDANLVTPPGHWERKTGSEAVRLFFDERKLRPLIDIQAMVGASDIIVLGALEALDSRGIRVPEEMAVVGFNNEMEGRSHIPPLTSVAAPFHEMGYESVELLMDLIKGIVVPGKTLVPRLVSRQSCGCVDPALAQAAIGDSESIPSDVTLESILASNRAKILSELAQAAGDSAKDILPGWEERLLDGFVGEFKPGSLGLFLPQLNRVLRQVIASEGDLTAWDGVISALRRNLASYLKDATLRRAEDLWQQSRVMLNEAGQQAQARLALVTLQRTQTLREVEMALLSSFDVAGLMDMLAKNLPKLGIPSCFVALYENPGPYKYPQPAPEWSRLVLAYTEKGRIELEPEGMRFRSSELVPAKMWPQGRQYHFIMQSLYFQDQQLGYALFEVGPRDGQTFDVLRAQISSAVKGALLMQVQKEAEQALLKERDALKSLIAQIQQSAASVTEASNAILDSSTQMATVTEEQASAVNQITATVQEIKSSAEQVTMHAQGVADAAVQAAQVSHKGTEAVNVAIAGMRDIQKKVELISENIQALAQQTHQIGNIIDSVTDIAGQSNILALNAAIEAAHAGELGERFRVVADEVKTLAGQSRQAARQVRAILGDIEKSTNLAVAATAEGTKGVDQGSELVSRSAETINELAKVVEQSAQAAQQIVAGVKQQTIGLDQIAIGMNDINEAAHQSAIGAQQSRKAAEDLNKLAEQLKLVVSQYQL